MGCNVKKLDWILMLVLLPIRIVILIQMLNNVWDWKTHQNHYFQVWNVKRILQPKDYVRQLLLMVNYVLGLIRLINVKKKTFYIIQNVWILLEKMLLLM